MDEKQVSFGRNAHAVKFLLSVMLYIAPKVDILT